jgi:hypothetical protein
VIFARLLTNFIGGSYLNCIANFSSSRKKEPPRLIRTVFYQNETKTVNEFVVEVSSRVECQAFGTE